MKSNSLITSPQNTHVKAARRLNQRRYRHAEGRLLLEGLRLVADAWRSGVKPFQVFYNSDVRAQQSAIHELLARLEASDVMTLACTEAVFASLTETVTPQGIAAVTPLPQLPLPEQLSLMLVLDGVRDPGNAGTLLRSAEAAGVDGVIFCPGTVDPFNEKVMRAGMGAHFRLAVRSCDDWSEVQKFLPPLLPLYLAEIAASRTYDAVDWRSPAGSVIGSEATGASKEMRQLAHPICIPMRGQTESLNAAMAGSIVLFEAARQRRS